MQIAFARQALPLAVAFMPLIASAQLTFVEQTGRLEARPNVVVTLEPGRTDSALIFQDSLNPSCTPPRCSENFFQEVSGTSIIQPHDFAVYTGVYASGDAVNLNNKADFSLTFDVTATTNVLLTVGHYIGLQATGLAPSSTSLAFQRQLSGGSFEDIALPTLGDGSDERQLRFTLAAGRYVISSSITFNPSLYFPTGLPALSNAALTESAGIRVTEVPEPATWGLAFGGLCGVFIARARSQRRSKAALRA